MGNVSLREKASCAWTWKTKSHQLYVEVYGVILGRPKTPPFLDDASELSLPGVKLQQVTRTVNLDMNS